MAEAPLGQAQARRRGRCPPALRRCLSVSVDGHQQVQVGHKLPQVPGQEYSRYGRMIIHEGGSAMQKQSHFEDFLRPAGLIA